MIKILNQPYLSLDQFVDVEAFDRIVDDIILGIAKSYYAVGPTNPGPGYVGKEHQSVSEIYNSIIKDPSHPYYETLKGLKHWEPLTFIKYKWPSKSLGHCLVLRNSPVYLDKHNEKTCIDYPIKENFKSFLNWIVTQNIFSSIGRIVIFLNEAKSPILEHRDYFDGVSRKDQFIWISPIGNKKFYIKDEEKKIYFNSRFCYFDNANIHGGDPADSACFSIRVDGVFSEEFKNKTKLSGHLDD